MMPADVPEHFRGTVSIWATVLSSDGSKQVTFDDSTPVQKQLIDIKYSRDTRKQFKPGLPYKGKVSLKVEMLVWLIQGCSTLIPACYTMSLCGFPTCCVGH